MKVLIACGGSGGHIFPAIALAHGLKEKMPGVGILFIGSDTALDRRIFEKERCNYRVISSNKLPYKRSLKSALFFVRLAADFLRSLYMVARYSPDVVAGFGGYVSSPVVLAAYILRIPIVVHEQNVIPGRANRALFRFADRIAVSFKQTLKYLGRFGSKAVVTGNPIRVDLSKDDRAANIRKLGLDPDKFTVLVVGGSQGAHNLNNAVLKGVAGLDGERRSRLQMIHITGVADYGWAGQAYKELDMDHRVFSFVDDIEQMYSASDLVLTRSGASAIFEIAYFGRPMILVPYPFAMSHQAENAKVFSENGAAIQIDESDLSAGAVRDSIDRLLDDKTVLAEMSKRARSLSVPDSSRNLASEILLAAKEAQA